MNNTIQEKCKTSKVTAITMGYFKRKGSSKRYYESIRTEDENYILKDLIVKLMQDYKIKKERLYSISTNVETVRIYDDHIARECFPYDAKFLTREEFLNLNL